MDLQLAGKVGIVTGASRGIGRAIAATLAAEGMRLTLVARSRDQLETLAASVPAESLVQALDLREPDAPAAAVTATLATFGRLDLLVNNAGATKRGDFFALTDADWADGFALKFLGAMRCSRAAWPHLQNVGGSVNAALLNLTKALADRGVADGIRVNAINPGGIATERLQTRLAAFAKEHGVQPAQAEREMAKASGVARFGQPDEIAALVAFLASPKSGYCHGAIVDADGGQTRTL